MDSNKTALSSKETKAQKIYPGAAVDQADDNRSCAQMVKDEVNELNNNPRNNDLDE